MNFNTENQNLVIAFFAGAAIVTLWYWRPKQNRQAEQQTTNLNVTEIENDNSDIQNLKEYVNSPEFNVEDHVNVEQQVSDMSDNFILLDDILTCKTYLYDRKFIDEERVDGYITSIVNALDQLPDGQVLNFFCDHIDQFITPLIMLKIIRVLKPLGENSEFLEKIKAKDSLRISRVRLSRLFGVLGVDTSELDMMASPDTSPRIVEGMESQRENIANKLQQTTQIRGFSTLNFDPSGSSS